MVEDRRKHWKPLDVGTVNLVAPERNGQGQVVLRLKRNPVLELPAEAKLTSLVTRLRAPHVVHGEKLYVVGDHAFKVADAVNRDAPASPAAAKKADPLPAMKDLLVSIADTPAPGNGDCISSVPAGLAPPTVVRHPSLFEALWHVVSAKPSHVIEGHSVAFSDPAEENFKGIGIFCGGGLHDICVAYKSLPAIFFSSSRGGEWVDIDVATDLGVTAGASRAAEENEIVGYYRTLINNTLSNIKGQLKPAPSLSRFPEPICLVFSGATSVTGNFIELVRTIYRPAGAASQNTTTRIATQPAHAKPKPAATPPPPVSAPAGKPHLSGARLPELSAAHAAQLRAALRAETAPTVKPARPAPIPATPKPKSKPPPPIEEEEPVEEIPDAAELDPEKVEDGLNGAADRRIVDFRRYLPASGRGVDVGTSNVVGAVRSFTGSTPCNIQRNAFLDVRSDLFTEKLLMKLGVERYDRGAKRFVIGNPAFEFANIFEKPTRRPMKNGMISPAEPDAIYVEDLVIRSVLGKASAPDEICAYSVQAEPIDAERNAVYHAGAIETILKSLGYAPRAIIEGQAVVYAELADEQFTGIGISCGGGQFNICISYASLPALAFSISRGGDWIDANVAQSLGLPSSQVCAIKESGIDLNRPQGRIEEAICIYYRNLIHYLIETIRERFESAQNMPAFRSPISVVCSGGTSMIDGFIDVFRDEFKSIDFPIPVKEIRRARDPMRTVARGCLEAALVETRAMEESAPSPRTALERADISSVSQAIPRAAAAKADVPLTQGDGKSTPWWRVFPIPDRLRGDAPMEGPACA